MDLSRLNRRRQEYADDHLYGFTGIDGQCIRFWFKDIEMVAKMIHADECVCLTEAVGLLLFEAKHWYRQHQDILTTWSDFKQHMIARFDSVSQPMNTSEHLKIDTLFDARTRTVVWHPQLVPCGVKDFDSETRLRLRKIFVLQLRLRLRLR